MFRRVMLLTVMATGIVFCAVGVSEARNLRRQDTDEGMSPSDIRPPRATPKQFQSPYQSPYQAPIQKGMIQKGGDCEPCVTFHYHGRPRCCSPTYQAVLSHCDPCSGCVVNLPVCLPVCCEGEPRVVERVGALGRSVVVYRWCCGTLVKVITDRCGDLAVHVYPR